MQTKQCSPVMMSWRLQEQMFLFTASLLLRYLNPQVRCTWCGAELHISLTIIQKYSILNTYNGDEWIIQIKLKREPNYACYIIEELALAAKNIVPSLKKYLSLVKWEIFNTLPFFFTVIFHSYLWRNIVNHKYTYF